MTNLPILPQRYGVLWRISKGGPIDASGQRMRRNEAGFPITITDIDGEETEEVSYFHDLYEWSSVNLSFNALDDQGNKPLIGFRVRGSVFSYREEEVEVPVDPIIPTDPNDPAPEPEIEIKVYTSPVAYTLTSNSIKSSDPNSGDTWVYPDDYPELFVDPNHPTQYGGVVLFAESPVKDKLAGEGSVSGIDDGDNDDGIIRWSTRDGIRQELVSGYNYIDVFDKADFSYTPRNSNDDQQIQNNDRFRLSPYYPDVKDPYDLAAPIYPMNMVNSFVPDGRDAVDVYYTVTMSATVDGVPIALENGTITVKQTCTQDTGNYSEQLDALLSYCNWNNPQDLSDEELSPYYPYMYPYTLINGFEGLGLGQTPTTRGDETDNAPLERGDVWYNPETEQRFYWSISDIPETIKIIDEGKRYRTSETVPCIWEPTDNCNPLKDRVNVPYGLLVDIVCEKGRIKTATISDESLPQYFQDGDEVVVSGGDGQGRLKINIGEPERWVSTYVSHV